MKGRDLVASWWHDHSGWEDQEIVAYNKSEDCLLMIMDNGKKDVYHRYLLIRIEPADKGGLSSYPVFDGSHAYTLWRTWNMIPAKKTKLWCDNKLMMKAAERMILEKI